MKRRPSPKPLPQRVPYPQTPETAKTWIVANGVCVSDLARAHGVPRPILVDLLRGQLVGLRGSAHKGAIVLGLKADPSKMEGASA